MNINEQKRFVFKKEYKAKQGIIPINAQLDIVHNVIYFNGGMCDSYSSDMFEYIINNPSLRNEYLREINIPINKV